MRNKILVVGATGQLGFDLMRTFGDEAHGLSHQDLEITHQKSVRDLFGTLRPEIVINAAAIVRTEWCENNPEDCFRVNTLGAYYVAKAAHEIGAKVVFFSTDYVFDGFSEEFDEDSQPNPLNIYGASKAAAENLVAIANAKHWIIRCGWLFGYQLSHKGHDFPRLMLKKAREQSEVRVVNDQIGCPTYTKDLSHFVREMIRRPVPYGIYHVSNQGSCTWFDWAKEVFVFKKISTPLTAIGTSDSDSKIHRPKRSILKNKKLQDMGIPLLRRWELALSEYFAELEDGKNEW
jgi:dTDP-4-dehydrorhamnose reductase